MSEGKGGTVLLFEGKTFILKKKRYGKVRIKKEGGVMPVVRGGNMIGLIT